MVSVEAREKATLRIEGITEGAEFIEPATIVHTSLSRAGLYVLTELTPRKGKNKVDSNVVGKQSVVRSAVKRAQGLLSGRGDIKVTVTFFPDSGQTSDITVAT